MEFKKIISTLLTLTSLCSFCACNASEHASVDIDHGENLLLSAVNVLSNAKDFKKAFDGNTRSSAVFEQDDTITFVFSKPVSINTVILREKAANCERFNIYAENADGNRTLLYSNDIIDKYLYCAFSETEVEKLVFEVKSAEKKTVKLQEISAYCKENQPKDFRVHTYYAYWGNEEYFTKEENQEALKKNLDIVTDIILIGNIYWNADGTLSYSADLLKKETDAIIKEIGEKDVRVWACILNPRKEDGSIDNSTSVKSINNHLDTLTDNILDFCVEYGFDGIDFDWEYPRLPHRWNAYNKLLVNLKAKLSKHGIMLSSALGPWGNGMSREAKEVLDYVNVMSYDWAKNKRNQHAEFYTCHYASARYFLKHGFKKEQLVLGVPFYGNATGKEYAQMSYNAFSVTDKGQNLGTADGKTYYFNGYNTIYSKTAFTYDNGFAGMMIWNGQLDLPRKNEYSLFEAMDEALDSRQ